MEADRQIVVERVLPKTFGYPALEQSCGKSL
jgi:hypothetical protein